MKPQKRFLFLVLILLLALVELWLASSAQAKEQSQPETLTEVGCQKLIHDELLRLPAGGVHYTPAHQNEAAAWSFRGITGARRTLKSRLAEFDLLQVYFRRAGQEWGGDLFDWDGQELAYVWVAYRMRLPNGESLNAYQEPLLDQFIDLESTQLGKYLVQVTARGPFVTPQGFSCAGLDFDPFCQVEQSFLPGMSQVFIESGHTQQDPVNGFLFWNVEVEKPLDVCKAQSQYGR